MSDIHENIHSLIAAYAIGAVPEDEIPSIRAHILTCEECFDDAESFARGAAVLTEVVQPVALPKGFEERVLQEVRGATQARKRRFPEWRRVRVPLLGGVVAVLAALLVVVGVSFVESLESQRRYQETVAALVHDGDAFSM